jgi:N-carbamoylputrescine amidase
MKDLRIAAVTCVSEVGQVEENLKRTIHWTLKARAMGATLVCFPELNLTGYCNSSRMADIALVVPDEITKELSRLAADQKITILAGMAEHNPNGLPYATHGIFSPDGGIHLYRKLHLAPPEKESFSAGDQVPVFQTKAACIGIQLCYDGHFPELSAIMRDKGAEVLFIPHASPHGTAQEKNRSWTRHLPARAFDNSVYVVACNQSGENCNGLQFAGNSLVIDPSGTILGKGEQGGEAMLLADLKQSQLKAVREHSMRHFYPQRRPGLYAKEMNQQIRIGKKG